MISILFHLDPVECAALDQVVREEPGWTSGFGRGTYSLWEAGPFAATRLVVGGVDLFGLPYQPHVEAWTDVNVLQLARALEVCRILFEKGEHSLRMCNEGSGFCLLGATSDGVVAISTTVPGQLGKTTLLEMKQELWSFRQRLFRDLSRLAPALLEDAEVWSLLSNEIPKIRSLSIMFGEAGV